MSALALFVGSLTLWTWKLAREERKIAAREARA